MGRKKKVDAAAILQAEKAQSSTGVPSAENKPYDPPLEWDRVSDYMQQNLDKVAEQYIKEGSIYKDFQPFMITMHRTFYLRDLLRSARFNSWPAYERGTKFPSSFAVGNIVYQHLILIAENDIAYGFVYLKHNDHGPIYAIRKIGTHAEIIKKKIAAKL